MELYFQSSVVYSLLNNVWLVLIPAINTQGFANSLWEEIVNGKPIDTNRDFPYNRKDNFCFSTFAGKILDIIYR